MAIVGVRTGRVCGIGGVGGRGLGGLLSGVVMGTVRGVVVRVEVIGGVLSSSSCVRFGRTCGSSCR